MITKIIINTSKKTRCCPHNFYTFSLFLIRHCFQKPIKQSSQFITLTFRRILIRRTHYQSYQSEKRRHFRRFSIKYFICIKCSETIFYRNCIMVGIYRLYHYQTSLTLTPRTSGSLSYQCKSTFC